MAFPAIRVDGLSKRYRLGQGMTLANTARDAIAQMLQTSVTAMRSVFDRADKTCEDREWFLALRDISFEIPRGQVVGIVGANGAGKSTLLKILSRVTEPTTGRVEIRGRVGSLIEVGTGFHSELTGRENTYLNGAILGMRRSEIDCKFDEIVAYAGVERFIDTPIKHYSSGMQMRLGFAVAAHLETEVLLVDEVLAVGDAEFQRKCLSTMSRVANDGRTVLFVSHNAAAVKTLCDRTIWLAQGRIAGDGPAHDVLSSYLGSAVREVAERRWHADGSQDRSISLRRVAARPQNGQPGDTISTRTPFIIEVDYCYQGPVGLSTARIALFNDQEILLFESAEPNARRSGTLSGTDLHRAACHLPSNLFSAGTYRLEVTVSHAHGETTEEPEALFFAIRNPDVLETVSFRHRSGAIDPALRWQSQVVSPSDLEDDHADTQ